MISAWHLLWIIPASSLISMFAIGLTALNKIKECDIELDEPLDGYYVDGDLNVRKREDDGKQDT